MPQQLRGAAVGDLDPTGRFSDRVDDYDRYRPGYPPGVIAALETRPPALAADVGAGTGIFSAALVDAGYQVIAVEPNPAMRARAGARGLAAVDGRAEATGLDDGAVDLITCAQSFHWFDVAAARVEFARIGRGEVEVLLVWNDRDVESGPLMRGYEDLLDRWGTDYRATTARYDRLRAATHELFGGRCEALEIEHVQRLDAAGLIGRFFSSSFAPRAGTPERESARRELEELFARCEEGGEVELAYVARAYRGRLR